MATYSNPQSAFIDAYKSQGFIGFGPGGDTDLQFANGTSQDNITAITNAANTWDWAPLAPPVGPNIKAFETAIWGDVTLTMEAKVNLANTFPLLESNLNNPPAIQGYWAYLVANAPAWLTSAVQTTVLNYASLYDIPLIA